MPDPLRLIRQVERPTVTFLGEAAALLPIAANERHCEAPEGGEAIR
jgi:hypothetical protein